MYERLTVVAHREQRQSTLIGERSAGVGEPGGGLVVTAGQGAQTGVRLSPAEPRRRGEPPSPGWRAPVHLDAVGVPHQSEALRWHDPRESVRHPGQPLLCISRVEYEPFH